MTKKKAGPVLGGLTKSDLAERVYERHGGLTKTEAGEIVGKIFETMKTSLVDGRQVKIQNFGVFSVIPRRSRAGVNPSTGRRIVIPAHKGLSFRPSPKLKRAVDKD